MDCRINAYSGGDIKGDPNFIFIDIDGTTDHKVIKKILNSNSKFKRIGGHPTVLFTGNGFHIYQPISSGVCLDDFGELANYCHRQQPSREFLKFAENYLSNGKSDPNHNPSFASCLVRIPGSINGKNGKEVQILQKWNGKRPNIALMLGSFMTWLLKNEIAGRSKFAKATNSKFVNNNKGSKINWIESLLKTPLDDYRKNIVNLVLAPYFVNIRQIDFANASAIIKRWLESCALKRKLNFYADSTINASSTDCPKIWIQTDAA